MRRATHAEQVQRLNVAVRLLQRQVPGREAVQALGAQFGLSGRQAYRYVRAAQSTAKPLPVPEAKAVFTVKLPKGLMSQVRRQARRQGRSISQWLGQALSEYLEKSRVHGQAPTPT